ncbi:MAG: ATP-binding protein [Coriobacteriia bacterium]
MTDSEDLIGFVSAVSGDAYLKVEESLGDGYVRLRISEAERRQAKHDIRGIEDVVVELLRNARDAHAQRIWIASVREGDVRRITVVDDGVGIPSSMHERVFEPRVTSKLETMVMDRWGVHGRGMALYSVRENADEARVVASDVHKGASVVVWAQTSRLSERADQSSWPSVERAEDGAYHVGRGPHNIVRRVVEFACEHPEVDVFLGTPTEVLATLHEQARAMLDASRILFCDDSAALPVWQRPAVCADAADLVDTAAAVGLPISERTAHRILAGETTSLEPVLAVVATSEAPEQAEPAPVDLYRDRRGLRIHHADLDTFRKDLEHAFDALAERYYLHLKGTPRVTVGRDTLRVTFTVEKED